MAAYEFPLRKTEALIYIYVEIINAKYSKVRRSFQRD
jgi:hypothetical protein